MPVELIGEGEYKLDSWKEIKVTDSFLEMEKDVTKCQNVESIQECTTKQYINRALRQCQCLPYNLGIFKKVSIEK